MATKVSVLNNLLKIDNGVKNEYYNAAWCTINFSKSGVVITDEGRRSDFVNRSTTSIPFADFQDGSGTSYSDEDAIAIYLSDKIG